MKSKGSSKSGNERPGGAGRLYAFLIDVAGEDEGAADIIADVCAVLDEQDWPIGGPTLMVRARHPLEEMDRGF